MRLCELNLFEMSYEDLTTQEMEILDNLPRTREGADEIIDYLLGMDGSVNAWITLLSEYEDVLTREEYRKFTSKAVECFDGNILKLESDDVEGGV